MSVLNKVIAAVTPPESEEFRRKARANAQAAAAAGDWLSMVLTHHQPIEAAFVAVKAATIAATRVAAQKTESRSDRALERGRVGNLSRAYGC